MDGQRRLSNKAPFGTLRIGNPKKRIHSRMFLSIAIMDFFCEQLANKMCFNLRSGCLLNKVKFLTRNDRFIKVSNIH